MIKSRTRYEEMKKQLRPEGRKKKKNSPEGEKKKRRVIFTVIYQTGLQSHLLWRGPQGNIFWQIFILNNHCKWVSVYPLVCNSHCRLPSKPPETQYITEPQTG